MGWRVVEPASPSPLVSPLRPRSLAPKTRCLSKTKLSHDLLSLPRGGGAGCSRDWVAPPSSPLLSVLPPKKLLELARRSAASRDHPPCNLLKSQRMRRLAQADDLFVNQMSRELSPLSRSASRAPGPPAPPSVSPTDPLCGTQPVSLSGCAFLARWGSTSAIALPATLSRRSLGSACELGRRHKVREAQVSEMGRETCTSRTQAKRASKP